MINLIFPDAVTLKMEGPFIPRIGESIFTDKKYIVLDVVYNVGTIGQNEGINIHLEVAMK